MAPSSRGSRPNDLRELVHRTRGVVLVAGVTGAVVGALVALVDHIAIEVLLPHILRGPRAVLLAAPLVALAASLLVRHTLGGGVGPATADEYLRAFHDEQHDLGLRAMAARLLAAIATVGLGAPMGLEGPAIYLGATVGDAVQRRSGRLLRGHDRRLLLVAGAAAGVAAIFKAPATGAVFALEVPYQDDLARRMLLPAMVASSTGYLSFVAMMGTQPLVPVHGDPRLSWGSIGGALLIGVLCGIVARGFAWMLRRAKHLQATQSKPLLVVGGGVAIAALAAVARGPLDAGLVLGPGLSAVQWALAPGHATTALLALLLLRCVATACALGGGGAGGVFIPLVAAGALLGRATAQALGIDPMLGTVTGMAAFLGGGYRVPLAAVTFAAESTGRAGFVVPALLAAVCAELVMGNASVTAYQRTLEDRAVADAIERAED